MTERVNSQKPLSVKQVVTNHTSDPPPAMLQPRDGSAQGLRKGRRVALWSIARFGLLTAAISSVLTLLSAPWLRLPLWMIFRRCVSIGAAISLWLSVKQLEKRSFRSYGFSGTRAGKRQLLFGLLLGLGTLGLLFGIGLMSGTCRIDITPDRSKLWWTVLGFIPVAALVSILEELVFRGFLLQQLLAFPRPMAVAVSSALYAVVHLKTTSIGLGIWLELIGLFLLGSVLSLSYLATNQLYIAFGLHTLLAYGARVNKLVVHFFPEPPTSWLMGTGRLVNGLVSWVLLLGVGGIFMWWTRSSHRGGAQYGKT